MTVLKTADDKQVHLDALQALLERPGLDEPTRKRIQDEIWTMRAGIQGERDAAYEIDFHYAQREGYAVIHDLRIEFNGRVAQIDHLLINRVLDVWVCETKAFSHGVKVDEFGEWYRYGGKFARGVASPVEQNRRHVEVLRDLFAKDAVKAPRRLGIKLNPTLRPVVLMANNARIDRPRTKRGRAAVRDLDTVIKVEQLVRTIEKGFDERSPVSFVAHVVGKETVHDLGRQLIALHRPQTFDWAAKFGLAAQVVPTASEDAASTDRGDTCADCGRVVSAKVVAYSKENADRFGGAVVCYDCQRSPARRPSARPNTA